jgi:hypothetical protein
MSQVSAPKAHVFRTSLQNLSEKSSVSGTATREEEEETDDDDEENPRPEGFRSHSSEGHHISDQQDDGAGGRDTDNHGACTEGVQGRRSNQGHVHAVGSPTIDGERDHAHLGHVHFDGCGNQDGRPPGTMDFDMDGGCMNGSSGHDGTSEEGVANKGGDMDVDMDGGCANDSLGRGGNMSEGAATEGEHPSPKDVDMDGGCSDASLGCDKSVGQGAAESGVGEQPLSTQENMAAEKRKNPPREAKGRKKDEPSPSMPRPRPKPKAKSEPKLKPESGLKHGTKPLANARLIERNYFEEVEFGDTSRLVEMIDLTQDMVSGLSACKDMRTEFADRWSLQRRPCRRLKRYW